MAKKVLYLLLVFGFFFSCSVQKRAHRKGYYVSWNHSSNSKGIKKETTTKANEEVVITEEIKTQKEKVEASAGTNYIINETFPKTKLILSDTCGDLVIMRNGTQVLAKVLEITDDKIKYKRCDNLEGPTIITSTDNVHTIKFVNGVSQAFEIRAKQNNYNEPKSQSNHSAQKLNRYALAAFILSILGIFPLYLIGSILGLIFAVKAEREIAKNPEKYKGEGLALAAKIISLVVIAIVILALVIIILAA